MRLLLDTHALYWWVRGDPKLGPGAREALENPDTDVLVSAASLWEMSIKLNAGKWETARDVLFHIEDMLRRYAFRELPITISHGRAAGRLKGPHTDPFDRVLIAQALSEGATVATADPVFCKYNIPVLWA